MATEPDRTDRLDRLGVPSRGRRGGIVESGSALNLRAVPRCWRVAATPRLQTIAARGRSVSHLARARVQMCGCGLSLAEIALAPGFADRSQFPCAFAREEGVSPGRSCRMVEPEEPGVDRRTFSA